jgi:adenylate cyclase
LPQHQAAIRGRAEPMMVRTVTNARTLSALANDLDVVAA